MPRCDAAAATLTLLLNAERREKKKDIFTLMP